jgi:hypothetical protein
MARIKITLALSFVAAALLAATPARTHAQAPSAPSSARAVLTSLDRPLYDCTSSSQRLRSYAVTRVLGTLHDGWCRMAKL